MHKNKKLIVISFTILMGLGLTGMQASKVQANSWGTKVPYITSKQARGTWYYKENGTIKKLVITAHTSRGKKLYKILPAEEFNKMSAKLIRADEKNHYRVSKKISAKWLQAKTIHKHGAIEFNADGWLAGAGNGTYFLPIQKIRHGKKVPTLRIGYGAGNWRMAYAYKSKALAK